jgi:hypothetical protein
MNLKPRLAQMSLIYLMKKKFFFMNLIELTSTWTNNKRFGDFEIITWELKTWATISTEYYEF